MRARWKGEGEVERVKEAYKIWKEKSALYCSEEDRKKIVRMIRGKEVGG